MKEYYIYIMASESGTLYIGVTGNIDRRVFEHKNELIEGFSKKYKCNKLVYYEATTNIQDALNREKQLKNWRRDKKEMLIKKFNPSWSDMTCHPEQSPA